MIRPAKVQSWDPVLGRILDRISGIVLLFVFYFPLEVLPDAFTPIIIRPTFIAQAQAIYYIDDADSIITYSPNVSTGYKTKWRRQDQKKNAFTAEVQQDLLFGKTATYTQCSFKDDCFMEIPFNGTGVTLYVAQDRGDIYNTTISLDGGPRINHVAYTLANLSTAYNLSLYDVQNLEYTTHTVNIKLDNSVTNLLFDYAVVTGDTPLSRSGSSRLVDAAASTRVLLGIMAAVLTVMV